VPVEDGEERVREYQVRVGVVASVASARLCGLTCVRVRHRQLADVKPRYALEVDEKVETATANLKQAASKRRSPTSLKRWRTTDEESTTWRCVML